MDGKPLYIECHLPCTSDGLEKQAPVKQTGGPLAAT